MRRTRIIATVGDAIDSVENPIPPRSEVIDIANAVYQGADAVMLSAETACGKHPFDALRVVSGVLEAAEDDIALNPHRKAALRA